MELQNTLENQVLALSARLAAEEKRRLEGDVQALVDNCQLTISEAPRAVARALVDPTYLDELKDRPQMLPGGAPLNIGFNILAPDSKAAIVAMRDQCSGTPKAGTGDRLVHNAIERSQRFAQIWHNERSKVERVFNSTTNTIDSPLKRVAIMQESIRDFATVLFPLRSLATVFSNVPLQGTDEIVVPYYPLQTAASVDWNDATGYVFSGQSNTLSKKITVNKRKYQPLDYSSNDFRRQPYFDAVRLGRMNFEKLGVDLIKDILSVVTVANYGAAVKMIPASGYTSDDLVDLDAAATAAMWPKQGRCLFSNTDIERALKKDPSYKLALNIGTEEVIQQGKLPKLSGFDFAAMPGFPDNGESLIGFSAFMSAILSAFCPVDPAPNVRAQLTAYDIVTDAASGISANYRAWGLAQTDRSYEVIESAYGYVAGLLAALQRLTSQA